MGLIGGCLLFLILIAVFASIWAIWRYNNLVSLKYQVGNSWKQIDVQLKRRHDLIPNLVSSVKGYMDFEQETLTKVVDARGAAVNAAQAGPAGAAQSGQAENLLTGALRQLFALVENYPNLKSNENVLSLQEQLTTTENQIGFARQHYNSTVRDFNTSIQTFPSALVAGLLGFRPRDYFQIEEADTAVPTVNLRS